MQNVIFASLLIGMVGGIVQALEMHGGVPLGLYPHPQQNRNGLFHGLAWAAPALWVVVLLNARGVARLIMQRARRTTNYGLWVMGITIILAVMWELSFELFARTLNRDSTYVPWYSIPSVRFLAWAATTFFILLLITPALISKSPNPTVPGIQPLFVWLLLSWLLMTGAWVHQLWGILISIACQGILRLRRVFYARRA